MLNQFLPANPPAASLKPSMILRPGLSSLPVGTERYVVGGGQTIIVDLEPGDGIELADIEGGQPCEVIAAGADGRVDPGLIGAPRRGGVSPPWCAGRAPSSLRE